MDAKQQVEDPELDLDDEDEDTGAELPAAPLAKYELVRPFWDGQELLPKGTVREFARGSQPSLARELE